MSQPSADDYLPGHGDPSYSVRHYDLALGYTVDTNRLDGDATLDIVTTQATQRLVLDLAHLEVGKVQLTGASLRRYSLRSGRLSLTLAAEVAEGTELKVVVRYHGPSPPADHAVDG